MWIIAVLACLSAVACGSASTGPASRSAAGARGAPSNAGGGEPPIDNDGDEDSSTRSYYDSDDWEVLGYGHPATGEERRSIAALVRRYHDLAARHDGPGACRLLNRPLSEVVTETYGGPRFRGPRTCAAVLSVYFEQNRRGVATEDAKLTIGQARVEGNQGFVMLGSAGVKPKRAMPVKRDGGAWKINDVLDTPLP
jgi:hypothetical protein